MKKFIEHSLSLTLRCEGESSKLMQRRAWARSWGLRARRERRDLVVIISIEPYLFGRIINSPAVVVAGSGAAGVSVYY